MVVTLPYLTSYLTLLYHISYLAFCFTLHLTLPYLTSYLTFCLTLCYERNHKAKCGDLEGGGCSDGSILNAVSVTMRRFHAFCIYGSHASGKGGYNTDGFVMERYVRVEKTQFVFLSLDICRIILLA